MHHDVQIARLGARRSRLPATGEPDPRAVLDPGRDLDLERAGPANRSRPVTFGARRLHDASAAVTRRARLRHREEPLVDLDRALAATLWTRDRRRSGLGPAAAASRTWGGTVDADRHRRPGHRVLERDPHLRLEIRPALRLAASITAPTGGPEEPTE